MTQIKTKFPVLFFLVVLSFLFNQCSNKNSNYKQIKDGIIIQTDPGFIKLQVCADNIIRVLVSPEDKLDEKESLMLVDYPDKKIKWKVSEEGDEISIIMGKLIVKINKQSHHVSFFDISGEVILSSAEYSFEPADVMGESVYHIKQNYQLTPDEAIYGLGQFQDGIMNYRGHDVSLVQENTIAVVPFLVSTQNYGILWDNYSYTKFHDGIDGMSLWSNVADAIDYYFVAGTDMDEVISGYRFLTGKAPMFGKWAYGYWQSKERYNSQDEILDVVREYRERKLPIDNIVQDWMYWGDLGWSALDFDLKRFPDPKGMIDTIHKHNMHIMISIWPNFALKTDVFKEMESKGFIIEGDDGKSRGLYDAYDEGARDLYWDWINRNMFSIGMDAWWMDATEPEVGGSTPDEIAENLGNSGYTALGSMSRYLNPFSLMSTKGVYDNQRKVTQDKRVYILTRSAFAGQQRYGAVTWSGDIHAQWDVFRNQISAGLNFCMTGIPYWTTDIGAFQPDNPLGNRDNAYREMYLRWFQYGVFNPMFRSHGSSTAREIWNFGGEDSWTYEPLVKFDNLRYRLLPYIYSLAWQITDQDYTMMRGLPFDFNDDPKVYNIDNQYMFGPAFLVTPVTEKMYYEKNYVGKTIPTSNIFDTKGKKGRLTTEFYNGINFDTLRTTGYIENLDINWNDGTSRPMEVNQYDNSIRLTGELLAEESGKYTVLTSSNDGIRVWIGDELVIDNWTGHGVTINTNDIVLEAGKRYPLKMEYFQLLGNSVLKLAWVLPSERAKLEAAEVPSTKSVEVYLPKGHEWIDFWRGDTFAGGNTIKVPAPIDEMPLLIKAGSIIPMGPYLQYADEKPADPIELRIYTGANAEFLLYEDENDNYNYEKGIYSTILFKWNEEEQALSIGEREGKFPGMLKERTFNIVWVGEGHGNGSEPETNPDHIVKYIGDQIIIKK